MDAGAIEEPAADDLGMEPEMEPEMGAEDEEEIDLDELLRELEGVTEEEVEEPVAEEPINEMGADAIELLMGVLGSAGVIGASIGIGEFQEKAMQGKYGPKVQKLVQSIAAKGKAIQQATGNTHESELAEALETIETLKSQLSEVNLLNAKLLYVNKVFKANNLTESQKVNIIAAFDKAETVKEVKLVFETVSESVVVKKKLLQSKKIN